MWLALTSLTRTQLELTDYADRYLVDRLSVVPGVAHRSRQRRAPLRHACVAGSQSAGSAAADGAGHRRLAAAARTSSCRPAASNRCEREFTLRTDTGLRHRRRISASWSIGRGRRRLPGAAGRSRESCEVRGRGLAHVGAHRRQVRASASASCRSPRPMCSMFPEACRPRSLRSAEDSAAGHCVLDINIDDSVFISESISEGRSSAGVALLLVLVVIYLFLGTLRATLIPAVTIPVSIICGLHRHGDRSVSRSTR